MQHVSSPSAVGAVLLSQKQFASPLVRTLPSRNVIAAAHADLTVQTFSVTRARVHAQVRASAHAYAHARKDEGALRRVLDAALSGGDVRVASLKPSSLLTRVFAWLLIPMMLLAPLAPAYANEAPLADRVAGDVAAIVANTDVAIATPTPDTAVAAVAAAVPVSASSGAVAGEGATQTVTPSMENSSASPTGSAAPASVASPAPASVSTQAPAPTPNSAPTSTTTPTSTPTPTPAPAQVTAHEGTTSAGSAGVGVTTTPAAVTGGSPSNSAGGSGGSTVVNAASSDSSSGSSSTTAIETTRPRATVPSATTSASTLLAGDATQTDSVASTTEDGQTPILDVAPDAVLDNVDAIRARLRNEMRGELRSQVRDEVKQEVKREVEEEVYRGCKNLDGTGYYCIPDAKSFGSPVIANERSISVVVQPDPITGNKQIFLVRAASTIQLTHGTNDNAFPVLDPSSDMLVWQSLQSGRWQIAYAHVNDIGVPKVKYLTNGENNFNPKIYAGRIVWQAWVDGNWEIFSATLAPTKIPDDALSAEHRAAGVDGDWLVKRITANNAPDMFPSVTSDTITWQAVDGGVWQVFAYDIATGESHRISKPGVKSDSPKVALVWNEEDANGQMRMVGSNVDGSGSFDLTALARRLVDNTREQPKSPVSNTEVVVVAPTVVRTESDATTTPAIN